MKAIQEIPMNNLFRFRSTLNNYYRIFRIPQGLKHQSLLSTDAAKLDLPTIRNAEGKRIKSKLTFSNL